MTFRLDHHPCGERYSPRHPRDCYYCRLALDSAARWAAEARDAAMRAREITPKGRKP